MKIAEIDSTFLARDVYRRWQSVIRKAVTDITIFTPYFDNTLLNLLQANTTIAPGHVTIVTDISPDNALEMPYQLKAAKKALTQGIAVLSLQGLHAKVLLVDGTHTSIGSQNFTHRGRKNREASVLPAIMLDDSRFVTTLHEWRSEAGPITEDEIDELLSALNPFFRKHKKMHEDIGSAVNEVLARQAEKKDTLLHLKEMEDEERKANILLREHLPELEEQSSVRLAQREIYAILKELNGYKTLMVENGGDLTDWEGRNPDGSFSPISLDRLSFYPIIFADTNRMGYARIAATRITYIRSGWGWHHGLWMVGDVVGDVSISFPDTGTESLNIVARIRTNDYHGSCRLGLSFDGKYVKIKERSFERGRFASQPAYDLFIANIIRTLLKSKDSLDAFLETVLRTFSKYHTLERERKNVEEYFDNSSYRITVIQVHGNPLLVFKKH